MRMTRVDARRWFPRDMRPLLNIVGAQNRKSFGRLFVRALPAATFILAASSCIPDSGSPLRRRPSFTYPPVAELVLKVSIGDSNASDPDYQFADIRDILIAPSGVIWVVDGDPTNGSGHTPRIRQFDSTGKFIRQISRRGREPGEYAAPDGLALMPDGTVAMRDHEKPGTITFYHSEGVVARIWKLGESIRWIYGGRYSIVVDTGGVMWLPFTGAAPSDDMQSGYAFLRVRSDGSVADTLPFPSIPQVKRDTLPMIVRTNKFPGPRSVRRAVR